MVDQYDFAIAIGPLLSSAGYLDTNNDPQQFVMPTDRTSWIANDVLLEPDCGAAQFNKDAEFIDFNAYLGNADAHVLALSDFPSQALRAIPLRDRDGFGTLVETVDVNDLKLMLELVSKTEPTEAASASQVIGKHLHVAARLLHLAILLRGFRTLARQNLLKPCDSAVIALPRHLWEYGAHAAVLVGIENFFLVDPAVAAAAAPMNKIPVARGGMSPHFDLTALTSKSVIVIDTKPSGFSISHFRADHGWIGTRLKLRDSAAQSAGHPDDIGDVQWSVLDVLRQDIASLCSCDADVETELRIVLRKLFEMPSIVRGEADACAIVLGEQRGGIVDCMRVLQRAASEGVKAQFSLNQAPTAERIPRDDDERIMITGPLRSVAEGLDAAPRLQAMKWLQEQIQIGAMPISIAGEPALGAAVLSGFSHSDLQRNLSGSLGRSPKGRPPTATRRQFDIPTDVVRIVGAVMRKVGDVHFSPVVRLPS